MFFIMGISNGRKEINYDSGGMNICKSCGAYCRYSVFCTYMYLSLFFMPVFKWSKQYYVECSACNCCTRLKNEIGKRIERGGAVHISSDDFEDELMFRGNSVRVCQNCGYKTQEDFEYCPKCGSQFWFNIRLNR